FTRNEIEVDPQGLPMDVQFKATTQAVVPTAGAVVVAHFDTESIGRAAILHATLPNGKPLPFGSDVLDADGISVGTVAQAGRIVARGLKSDRGVLSVRWGSEAGKQCQLEYTLPASRRGADAFQVMNVQCREAASVAAGSTVHHHGASEEARQ
ncbi:FimD/PapC C-terminal domain-containing protein, partial [Cupriavidus sp. IDO]|uniref:FimD/PapC C-terminal domain-containing protein n=1 Tax=Cupriavidus sp. IDO TaxID=1539142 RepID=UPI0005796237